MNYIDILFTVLPVNAHGKNVYKCERVKEAGLW